MRNQRHNFDSVAIRVQRGVAIEIGFQAAAGQAKVSLMLSVLGSGPSRSFLVVLIVVSPVEEQRLVRPQHQIPTDDDANRQSWLLGQGGLNVEVAPDHLLTDLIDASCVLSRPATMMRLPSYWFCGAASSTPAAWSASHWPRCDAHQRYPRGLRSRPEQCQPSLSSVSEEVSGRTIRSRRLEHT